MPMSRSQSHHRIRTSEQLVAVAEGMFHVAHGTSTQHVANLGLHLGLGADFNTWGTGQRGSFELYLFFFYVSFLVSEQRIHSRIMARNTYYLACCPSHAHMRGIHSVIVSLSVVMFVLHPEIIVVRSLTEVKLTCPLKPGVTVWREESLITCNHVQRNMVRERR